MIQRIVGIIASLAIVAVIVFTILGSGSYKSMLPEELLQPKVEVVTSTAVMQDITEQKEEIDSVAIDSTIMEAVPEREVE